MAGGVVYVPLWGRGQAGARLRGGASCGWGMGGVERRGYKWGGVNGAEIKARPGTKGRDESAVNDRRVWPRGGVNFFGWGMGREIGVMGGVWVWQWARPGGLHVAMSRLRAPPVSPGHGTGSSPRPWSRTAAPFLPQKSSDPARSTGRGASPEQEPLPAVVPRNSVTRCKPKPSVTEPSQPGVPEDSERLRPSQSLQGHK